MTAEIINPDIKRVDAVDGPATGMPFLILKSEQLPVAKADGEPDGDPVEDIEADDVQDGANIDGESVDDADANAAEPGAPAWEATDAAKARVATDALVQARGQVQELCSREAAEGDDQANVYDLEDACCAIDCALAILAKFAVDEQAEADTGQMEAEADARALGLIKALSRRVPGEEPVNKTIEPAPVAKADGDAMVAVYTQDGKLLGSVESDDITPLADAPAADSDAVTEGDAPAGGADTAPAAEAPAPEPVADAAAPAAPAAAPAAAPEPAAAAPAADGEPVAKSLDDVVAEAVAKALGAAVAAAVEPYVQSNAELAERVLKMENTPRNNGPMLSGQMPHMVGNPALRGHADADQVRKQLADETDPGARVLGVAGLIKANWQRNR